MSDTYFHFSEVVQHITAEEEAWLRKQLEWVAVHKGSIIELEDGEDPDDAEWIGQRFLLDLEDDDLEDRTCEFGFEFCDDDSPWGRHLWLYGNTTDYQGPLGAAWLIHLFLKKFRPDQCWKLTWAETVERMRVGRFGGGFVFVTSESVQSDWLFNIVETMRNPFEEVRRANGPDA